MKSTDAANFSRSSRLLLATILRAATVLISGCATPNLDLATETQPPDKATVLFQRVPSEDVVVSEVRAVRDAEGLTIYGRVQRTPDNCCDPARGHVDISIVGPDGVVVDTVSVPYSPRNIPKVRTRSARFTARIPYAIPEDVPLRITYHKNSEHASVTDLTDTTLSAHHSTTLDGKS